jgi:hypothetical protein
MPIKLIASTVVLMLLVVWASEATAQRLDVEIRWQPVLEDFEQADPLGEPRDSAQVDSIVILRSGQSDFLAEPEDPAKVRMIAEPEDPRLVCVVQAMNGPISICENIGDPRQVLPPGYERSP